MTELEQLLAQAQNAIQAAEAQGVVAPQAAPEVPASASTEAASAPQYTVQYGDTLAGIAEACGVSLAQLMTWNGLINDAVPVGATLAVGA